MFLHCHCILDTSASFWFSGWTIAKSRLTDIDLCVINYTVGGRNLLVGANVPMFVGIYIKPFYQSFIPWYDVIFTWKRLKTFSADVLPVYACNFLAQACLRLSPSITVLLVINMVCFVRQHAVHTLSLFVVSPSLLRTMTYQRWWLLFVPNQHVGGGNSENSAVSPNHPL